MLLVLLALVSTNVAAQSPNRAAEQAQRRAATGNLVGHGGPIKAIAVSPDGKQALTGSFDYSAILWDISAETPKQLLRLADHNGAVNAVAFVSSFANSTRRALTAGDDSIVRLWDLSTGKLIHKFEGHDPGSKIVGLSVLSDGTMAVSSGWDRTARLWNLDALGPGPVLRDHRGPVNAAVFNEPGYHYRHPGGLVYTASYDGEISIFRTFDGAFVRRVVAKGQSINALTELYIPGGPHGNNARPGTLLFGSVSGESGIIDAETGKVIHRFPDVQRPILAVADGSMVAVASGDGRIRLFDKENWSLKHEYKSAFGPVWALAMRDNDKGDATALYYGGLDDFATYWPFAPRAPFEAVDTSQYPRRFQQQAAASDDPIAKGELQFARKCSICHTLTPDSANRAGPTLHNVFGRRIATLPGYNYSPELKTLDIVWNAETIAKLFELGPDKFTPGSKMPLQVMSDKAERDALITFLEVATK